MLFSNPRTCFNCTCVQIFCIQIAHWNRNFPPFLFCTSSLSAVPICCSCLKQSKSLKTIHFSNKFNLLGVHIFQVQGISQARKNPSKTPYALETKAQHSCTGGSVLSDLILSKAARDDLCSHSPSTLYHPCDIQWLQQHQRLVLYSLKNF